MKKTFTLTVTFDEEGMSQKSENNGFQFVEVIGFLEYEKSMFIENIKRNLLSESRILTPRLPEIESPPNT